MFVVVMGLHQEQLPSYLIDANNDATASQVSANHPTGVASVPVVDISTSIKRHAVIVDAPAMGRQEANALRQHMGASTLQFALWIHQRSVDCEWVIECGADCLLAGFTEKHIHDYSGKAMTDILLSGLAHRDVQCQALALRDLADLSFAGIVDEVQCLEVACHSAVGFSTDQVVFGAVATTPASTPWAVVASSMCP